ncbi:DUF2065 family protein [Elusimicrobiota bacterium]
MTTLAKIISLIIIIKSAGALFFPSFMLKIAEKLLKIKDSTKRIGGLIYILLGAFFIYLTRVYLEIPLVHWVIAVTGIYIILVGIVLAAVPALLSRFVVWFFQEKEPVSVIGLIIMTGGLVLYFVL